MQEAAEADGTREAVGLRQHVLHRRRRRQAESAALHMTIAVPYATGETLGGLAEEGSYTRAGTWVMQAGTSSAHIMLPGR